MSNVVVDPRTFREAFTPVLSSHESLLREAWPRGGEFTKVWTSRDGILEKLGKRLELECHPEYWTIDAVFYKQADTRNFPVGPARYAEAIAIALEHENISTSAHEELNKLSIIDAPLKVLVTYADPGDYADELLSRFADILVRADTFGDFATRRRHVVLFGSMDGSDVKWRYYIFTGHAFSPLE